MKFESSFQNLVTGLSEIPEVEAIVLSGSRVTNTIDAGSDYDLYIYSSKMISVEDRRSIIEKNLSYFELNNTLWETEDQGYLKGSGTEIDIIYRDFTWIKQHLTNLLDKFEVSMGYSTCIWANVIQSKILFDRNNRFKILKDKFDIPFPDELVKAIIAKNYGVLRTIFPSYVNQIKKAKARDDIVSVQHRITAFLASYFDIIFALNKQKHPGERSF